MRHTFYRALLFSALIPFAALSHAHADLSSATPEPVFVCHRASSPITIEGKRNPMLEPAWRKAQVIKNFLIPVTMKPAISKTEVRMLWDDQYLYVAIKSVLTKRDDPTCTEDCLEIFIKPDAENTAYCNFEINALNTVFDALNHTMREPGAEKWNCEGLRSAVWIKGTINDSSDVDSYWQLEEAIPLKELPLHDGKLPQVGDTWKFHVARYDYSKYLPEGMELSSCAHLTKADFHDAAEWCTLKFAK
jgi:hypothetical protein